MAAPNKTKVYVWTALIGLALLFVMLLSLKSRFDDWSAERAEAKQMEALKLRRDRAVAAEAAKSPEQRERERLAREEQAKAATIAAEKAREAKILFRVQTVAGRGPAEVESVLGKPTSKSSTTALGRSAPKYTYRGGLVEIVYVAGKAEWITVQFEGNGALPDNTKSILELVGLPPSEPSWESPGRFLRWEFQNGFRTINTGGTEGKANFMLLCKTEVPG